MTEPLEMDPLILTALTKHGVAEQTRERMEEMYRRLVELLGASGLSDEAIDGIARPLVQHGLPTAALLTSHYSALQTLEEELVEGLDQFRQEIAQDHPNRRQLLAIAAEIEVTARERGRHA